MSVIFLRRLTLSNASIMGNNKVGVGPKAPKAPKALKALKAPTAPTARRRGSRLKNGAHLFLSLFSDNTHVLGPARGYGVESIKCRSVELVYNHLALWKQRPHLW